MKKVSVLLAICLSIALLAGCAQQGSSGGNNSDVIKIGVNYELSGGVATYGQSSVEGLELAIKEINEAGGVNGKQIQLVKYDNKSEEAEATTLAS